MSNYRPFRSIFWIAIVVIFSVQLASAQSIKHDREKVDKCETNILSVDESILEYKKANSGSIIIIAYRNKNERSMINRFRLDALKRLIESRKAEVKLVLAEGKPVLSLGRADIFVNGILFRTVSFEKDKNQVCTVP